MAQDKPEKNRGKLDEFEKESALESELEWNLEEDSEAGWDSEEDSERDPEAEWDSEEDSEWDPEAEWDTEEDSEWDPEAEWDTEEDSEWDPEAEWDSEEDSEWDPEAEWDSEEDLEWDPEGERMPFKDRLRALFAFLKGHKTRVALIAVGLCVLLTSTLLVFAFALPGGDVSTLPIYEARGSSVSLPQTSAPESAVEEDEPIVPTILPETEDAGMEYAQETLFLGDSNTERMLYYTDVTGVTVDNGFGVVGMGIDAFPTAGCARFEGESGLLTMPQVVELLQPRRVVMTFGTNNVGMQVDKFIDQYKTAVNAVKDAYSYTDIIIGSIFPVDRYRQNTSITMERIDAMNEALAAMCEELDVKFLSWGDAMYDEELGFSTFEHTIQDGAHLSRSGMTAVFDYFRTHSYITRDKRPTPLKAVPRRIAVQPQTIAQDDAKKAGPIDWAAVEAAKGPVTVVFGTWDETNGTSGGGSVSPGSVSVKPGGTSGSVTATAKQGYTFVGWSFGSGTSGGGGATTNISVNSAVSPGTTLSVTAVFRQTGATSSSSSSSSSSSVSSSTVPSSSSKPIASSSSSGSSSSQSQSSSSQTTSSSSQAQVSSSQAVSSSSQASSAASSQAPSSITPPPVSSETPAPSVPDPPVSTPDPPVSTPDPAPSSPDPVGDASA